MTQSGDEWRCRVLLRREFDRAGNRLNQVSEVLFGDTIKKPEEVEERLRRAQLAILHPDIEQHQWLNASKEGLAMLLKNKKSDTQFSKNVVCVDLSGSDLTDLSFIDLPGTWYLDIELSSI
jgi:hypothetical protein